MDASKPWYQSIKTMVFLIVFGIVTIGLVALVIAGKLPCNAELVGTYIGGVVALACGLFLGRGVGSVGRGISDFGAMLALLLASEPDDDEGPPEPEDEEGD